MAMMAEIWKNPVWTKVHWISRDCLRYVACEVLTVVGLGDHQTTEEAPQRSTTMGSDVQSSDLVVVTPILKPLGKGAEVKEGSLNKTVVDVPLPPIRGIGDIK